MSEHKGEINDTQKSRAVRRCKVSTDVEKAFVDHVNHEIRTPLNAILGFSEAIQGQLLGPIENDEYLAYATHIHDSGEDLLRAINVILGMSGSDFQ